MPVVENTLPFVTTVDAIRVIRGGRSTEIALQDFINLLSALMPIVSTAPTINYGQVVTTGAVALPNQAVTQGLVLTADAANAGTIYVGASDVTADRGQATSGYPLVQGQSISYACANADQIYIIGSNAGDVLNVTGN